MVSCYHSRIAKEAQETQHEKVDMLIHLSFGSLFYGRIGHGDGGVHIRERQQDPCCYGGFWYELAAGRPVSGRDEQ